MEIDIIYNVRVAEGQPTNNSKSTALGLVEIKFI